MEKEYTKTVKLLVSRVEIDPLDDDYRIRNFGDDYPLSYIVKLVRKANELGREGKRVDILEVQENYATGNKYIDLIEMKP